MSINSRLRTIQKSLQFREVALLWLKTSQARGGYSEYWKIGEFQPWVSEGEEAALLYYLVFEVNGAVITAAQGWRVLSSWASLLGISMIDSTTPPKVFQPGTAADLAELWRQKLCNFLADVVALEQAVGLISEGYFDQHDVLFSDAKEELASSYDRANLLVLGFNRFAEENGQESIDIDVENGQGRRVQQLLNEWVMLSRSKAFAACGRVFEARDEVMNLLTSDTTPSLRE